VASCIDFCRICKVILSFNLKNSPQIDCHNLVCLRDHRYPVSLLSDYPGSQAMGGLVIFTLPSVPTFQELDFSHTLMTSLKARPGHTTEWKKSLQLNNNAVAKVPSRWYRNSESRVPSTFCLW